MYNFQGHLYQHNIEVFADWKRLLCASNHIKRKFMETFLLAEVSNCKLLKKEISVPPN